MKKKTAVVQIEPALFVDSIKIPAVLIGGSFKYLGKLYDFEMKNKTAKVSTQEKLETLLSITSKLKIKAQTKLKILKLYIHSQLQFELKQYNFGATWIDANLDALCTRHIRIWLDMPISTCIKEMMTLPKQLGGLNIPTLKITAEKLWLHKRYSLKSSAHSVMNQIWADTSSKHVPLDELLQSEVNFPSVERSLKNRQIGKDKNHFYSLDVQGTSAKIVSETISKKNINSWNNTMDNLPESIFKFARKALQQQLPTAANLARWKRIFNPNCGLCNSGRPQTNKHVLSNCAAPIALERYTSRHDGVLRVFADWILQSKSGDQTLFVDINADHFTPVSELFHQTSRPDIALAWDSTVAVLELTVCHETNLEKSKLYKMNKYTQLKKELKDDFKNNSLQLFTWEVSTLGFVSDLTEFTKAANLPRVSLDLYSELTRKALFASQEIYCLRNTASKS